MILYDDAKDFAKKLAPNIISHLDILEAPTVTPRGKYLVIEPAGTAGLVAQGYILRASVDFDGIITEYPVA